MRLNDSSRRLHTSRNQSGYSFSLNSSRLTPRFNTPNIKISRRRNASISPNIAPYIIKHNRRYINLDSGRNLGHNLQRNKNYFNYPYLLENSSQNLKSKPEYSKEHGKYFIDARNKWKFDNSLISTKKKKMTKWEERKESNKKSTSKKSNRWKERVRNPLPKRFVRKNF